jgi:transcription-repair coupling factor (superfamily II helicase)
MNHSLKHILILLAMALMIAACSSVSGSNGTSVPGAPVTPGSGDSAATQQAQADRAMQHAQLQLTNAHAASENETAQARAAGDVVALGAAATAQALSVASTQLAITADAANFPSTQAAVYAQQTAQAIEVKATADAQAMLQAQQQAQTTATAEAMSAQQTAQAIEAQGTVEARAVLLVQQQAQATATVEAMSAQQTAQAAEAIGTVDARAMLLAQQQGEATVTAQAMQREGVTAAQAASASQRRSALVAWLIPIGAAFSFGLVLLLGAKVIGYLIDEANQRRSLEIQRLALLGTLFTAPSETIIFDDPQRGFGKPQLLTPPDNGNGYGPIGSIISHAPMIDAEAPPVIVMLSTGDMIADRAEAREEVARCKLAMKLIRDAINHVGAHSNRIPSAAQLCWPEGAWTIAVAILRPYGVEILQGEDGGTYLVGQYPNLQALYIAIGERRLAFYPSSVESFTNN